MYCVGLLLLHLRWSKERKKDFFPEATAGGKKVTFRTKPFILFSLYQVLFYFRSSPVCFFHQWIYCFPLFFAYFTILNTHIAFVWIWYTMNYPCHRLRICIYEEVNIYLYREHPCHRLHICVIRKEKSNFHTFFPLSNFVLFPFITCLLFSPMDLLFSILYCMNTHIAFVWIWHTTSSLSHLRIWRSEYIFISGTCVNACVYVVPLPIYALIHHEIWAERILGKDFFITPLISCGKTRDETREWKQTKDRRVSNNNNNNEKPEKKNAVVLSLCLSLSVYICV